MKFGYVTKKLQSNIYHQGEGWGLRKPKVANFADIIKIVTMFTNLLKEHLKIRKSLKSYVSKCNL